MAFTLRAGTPADANAIAELHVRTGRHAFAEYLGQAYVDAWDPVAQAERWREGYLAAGDGRVLVAEEDGRILGFASHGLNRDDLGSDIGELYVLSVDIDSWGRGIGTALVRETETRLHAAGFSNAILWAFTNYDRTRRFYEHRGWAVDGASQTHSTGAELVRYTRQLTSTAPAP
jgi:GNAT superfamily N-acetyltransferase